MPQRFNYLFYLNGCEGFEKEVYELLLKKLEKNKKNFSVSRLGIYRNPENFKEIVINLKVRRELYYYLPRTTLIAGDFLAKSLGPVLVLKENWPKSTTVETCEGYHPRYLYLSFEVPYLYKWTELISAKKGEETVKHFSKELKLENELMKVSQALYNCLVYLEKNSIQMQLD